MNVPFSMNVHLPFLMRLVLDKASGTSRVTPAKPVSTMCDRITQVQDQINQIAEHMCNAIGMLQQTAPPSALPGRAGLLSDSLKPAQGDFDPKDLPLLFATLLARSVKELDRTIDLLPAEFPTESDLVADIKKLSKENEESARLQKDAVTLCQKVLSKVQEALKEIAESEVELDRLEL